MIVELTLDVRSVGVDRSLELFSHKPVYIVLGCGLGGLPEHRGDGGSKAVATGYKGEEAARTGRRQRCERKPPEMPQRAFRGDRDGRKRDIDAEDPQSGRVKATQDAKLNLQLRFSQ